MRFLFWCQEVWKSCYRLSLIWWRLMRFFVLKLAMIYMYILISRYILVFRSRYNRLPLLVLWMLFFPASLIVGWAFTQTVLPFSVVLKSIKAFYLSVFCSQHAGRQTEHVSWRSWKVDCQPNPQCSTGCKDWLQTGKIVCFVFAIYQLSTMLVRVF